MNHEEFGRLRAGLRELRACALEQERELRSELSELHPNHAAAGRNLAHYLAIRQHDIRDLQRELATHGLSSLGRMEKWVLATIDAVDRALAGLAGQTPAAEGSEPPPTSFETAEDTLRDNTSALLGPAPRGRATRIMVTLPLDAGPSLIEELVGEGTDVVRINCAKGDRQDWGHLIEQVHLAAEKLGRSCKILCDLAGPNPRTFAGADSENGETIAKLKVGERLLLASALGAKLPKALRHEATPVVGCTLPSIVLDLRPDERVFYDDGKLAGVVKSVDENGALIEVTFARKDRVKLRPNKGLNFPDSKLRLPSLTEKDLSDLEFIATHADMVGQSFVRDPDDVLELQRELARLGALDLGIVLKIETGQAFANLPRLLLTAMRSRRVGVMVARGDMAIELGFERMAEAQEEVLWLCEAALVPVIWATQVLENLGRTGVPSRAEVTDAAMSGRAECVMLNQGEHVTDALRFLGKVLGRMQEHQEKKRSLLRRLRISSLA